MTRMLIVIIMMLLLLAGSASAQEWDSVDKTLYGILIVSTTIDSLQTCYIYDHEEWEELNPVLDWGMEQFGKGFLPVYFAASFLAKTYVIDVVGPKYRKVVLGFFVGSSMTAVGLNYAAGIKVEF